MKQFVYDEILVKVKKFEWRGEIYEDLLELLHEAGQECWELVGEVKGRIIIKKVDL